RLGDGGDVALVAEAHVGLTHPQLGAQRRAQLGVLTRVDEPVRNLAPVESVQHRGGLDVLRLGADEDVERVRPAAHGEGRDPPGAVVVVVEVLDGGGGGGGGGRTTSPSPSPPSSSSPVPGSVDGSGSVPAPSSHGSPSAATVAASSPSAGCSPSAGSVPAVSQPWGGGAS